MNGVATIPASNSTIAMFNMRINVELFLISLFINTELITKALPFNF